MDALLCTTQRDLDTIGIKYLHYYLLAQGYDSGLLYLPEYDSRDSNKLKNIRRFIDKARPKLIGISLMSTEYNNVRHLTEYIKENFRSLPVIWGGIHPTIAPEMCLENADYVCIGEGERTLSELTGAIVKGRDEDIPGIKNLCYRRDGRIIKNDLHQLLDNLDGLPLCEQVARSGYIQHRGHIVPLSRDAFRKYARYSGTVYSIITSRGCPFSCTYCCNNVLSRLYHGNRTRRRSAANVISELRQAVADNPRIEYVNFQDDCFLSCTGEYLEDLCKAYKKEVRRPFIIRSVPVNINREKMEYLKSAGLGWISVGLQSGSDRVCGDIYHRRFLKKDFLNAARLIKEYDVAAFYDVILDNPFEKDDDRIETISALIELPKPYYMQFFSLSLYLGTELYERALRECPEYIGNYLEKNYQSYKKTVLNDMTRIAAFGDASKMKGLIGLYRENPDSLRFRFSLFIMGLLSKILLEPLAYLRVIALSQGGSYFRAFKVLRFYFKEGLSLYLKQFQ